MNQENLKFLQDRLFYLGTEKRLHSDLEKNMGEGKPEFSLLFSNHYDKDKLSASLHFRKSDNSDMYFLNRYDATLQKPAQESKTQTFYLDNGKGVTMKEAYNLLDGRSVNKDLKNRSDISYNAWLKLDFSNKDEKGNHKVTQYHKNYGYDLQSELLKLPLAQRSAEDIKQLSASLERGNLQQVKLNDNSSQLTYSLSANPQFKTIDIFDEKGRPLSKSEKLDLYSINDGMKKATEEGIDNKDVKMSQTLSAVHEPVISKDFTNILKQQSVQSSLNKSEKSESKEQKPEQKKNAREIKKERVASLLPKKQSGHKKGLSL